MSLYPPIEPYNSGHLKVSDLHQIYFEECGNPNGVPVVHLHGGPGASSLPDHRRFFDPKFYRIILFDQRGSGKSMPLGEIKENTTWDLVEDLEKIRIHLNINKWIVFGGSWGSSLGLAYAQTHPQSISGIILRGIWLQQKWELDWLFKKEGAGQHLPEAWDRFSNFIPLQERDDLLKAYHSRIQADEGSIRTEAVLRWYEWEAARYSLKPEPVESSKGNSPALVAFAKIESHFMFNRGFLKTEDQLLRGVDKILSIPAKIIHGRLDMTCPVRAAELLHAKWPEASLQIVENAAHSPWDAEMIEALITATEEFKKKVPNSSHHP
ncbi:MAG: proline iminopeptidase [Bacteriovoracaceae bacterium]|nr:proline iminopeptidase [Bacteriovoracaceae bacterium]